jgi:membrane-bound serine protease (ClpP class)
LLRYLPRLPGSRRLVLGTTLAEGGAMGNSKGRGTPSLVGATGEALTPLRPAGIAALAGARVDVVSQGEFIDPGERVLVTRDDGTRVVVRRAKGSESEGGSE